MPAPADPHALLELAIAIALDAGALLAERLRSVREVVLTKSSETDMVTEVDRDAEALIVGRIRSERPDDAILGEEGGALGGGSGVRWVVDPLDGTTNYLYGYPSFAVSIGVQVDGATVAGVVRDVAHGETYTALRGGGAFCDGRRLSVSAKDDLATALVGTGFAYAAARRAEQAALLARVLPAVRDIRRAGSAAIDLCWVASGRLDGYYEQGVQPWDVTAGVLLVEEAGGRVRVPADMAAAPVVAAGPALFDALCALVA